MTVENTAETSINTEVVQQQGMFDIPQPEAEAPVEAPVEQTETTEATAPVVEETAPEATQEAEQAAPSMEDLPEKVVVNSEEDIDNALSSAGMNPEDLVNEINSGGLSTESREKLDNLFGKYVVDMYLQSAQVVATEKFQKEEAVRKEAFNEVTGGDFTPVFEWATNNLGAEEYKEYQKVINGSDVFAAKLALSDLHGRSQAATAAETPAPIRATAVAGEDNSPLSAHQYRELIVSGEYYKDKTGRYDARRRAGMEAGI